MIIDVKLEIPNDRADDARYHIFQLVEMCKPESANGDFTFRVGNLPRPGRPKGSKTRRQTCVINHPACKLFN